MVKRFQLIFSNIHSEISLLPHTKFQVHVPIASRINQQKVLLVECTEDCIKAKDLNLTVCFLSNYISLLFWFLAKGKLGLKNTAFLFVILVSLFEQLMSHVQTNRK